MTNKTYKFLLVTQSGPQFVESTLDDMWLLVHDLKYPAGFISLTIMEETDGPY